MAQRTRLNPCEFVAIKVDNMSFVMPNNRTTVPVIKLIPILQSSKNGESFLFSFFSRAWMRMLLHRLSQCMPPPWGILCSLELSGLLPEEIHLCMPLPVGG